MEQVLRVEPVAFDCVMTEDEYVCTYIHIYIHTETHIHI